MRSNLSQNFSKSLIVRPAQGHLCYNDYIMYCINYFITNFIVILIFVINLSNQLINFLQFSVRMVVYISNFIPKLFNNNFVNLKLHAMTSINVSVARMRSLTVVVFILSFMFSMDISAQYFNPNSKEFVSIELQSAKTFDDWRLVYLEELKTLELGLGQPKIQPEDLALYTAQKAVLDFITKNYNPKSLSMISDAYKDVYSSLDASPILKNAPKEEFYNRCTAMIEILSETPQAVTPQF